MKLICNISYEPLHLRKCLYENVFTIFLHITIKMCKMLYDKLSRCILLQKKRNKDAFYDINKFLQPI